MTTQKYTTLLIPADPDKDDCLTAAVELVLKTEPLLSRWGLDAIWEGGENGPREYVEVSIPAWATGAFLDCWWNDCLESL